MPILVDNSYGKYKININLLLLISTTHLTIRKNHSQNHRILWVGRDPKDQWVQFLNIHSFRDFPSYFGFKRFNHVQLIGFFWLEMDVIDVISSCEYFKIQIRNEVNFVFITWMNFKLFNC